MIASLRGTLLRKDAPAGSQTGNAVIEAAGVGYRVFLSQTTLSSLPQAGEAVFLHTVTVVREDSIHLFGFAGEMELCLFNLLVQVKGIGPKLALAALSGMRPADLAGAIAGGDAARIATVPGIGRKTAERIVLELKDKVGSIAVPPEPGRLPMESGSAEDAVSALVNMGFRPSEGKAALRQVLADREGAGEKNPPLDALIRECLKILSGGKLHG